MKLATIVGARPQFIKAAAVSRAMRGKPQFSDILIHTGQHYDANMSAVFFDELDIPKPAYNLGVGSASHGEQTGAMLARIEKILIDEKPDWVIIYGDTNSTLAGALAAAKLHIKVAHVEAGLRSFNRNMPEEINRIAADHMSDLLLAPTENAMRQLAREGLSERSILAGDVMFDSLQYYSGRVQETHRVPGAEEPFLLATIHRQENTDDETKLRNIFSAFSELQTPVILPLHPRTRKFIAQIPMRSNIRIIDPVGYFSMLWLLRHCSKVLTDSGGLQKEAYMMNKQCLTLRGETEWIETLDNNWNVIVGTDTQSILDGIQTQPSGEQQNVFGDGHASEKILCTLEQFRN